MDQEAAALFRKLQAPCGHFPVDSPPYTLNFIDRTILATLGQAIKVDLKLL